MLDGARQYVASQFEGSQDGTSSIRQYEFIESPAESLGFIEDGSVDLVVSGSSIPILALALIVNDLVLH